MYDDFIKRDNNLKKKIGKIIPTINNNNNLIKINNDIDNDRNKDKDINIIRPSSGGIFIPKPSKKNDGFRFKNDKSKKGKK